VVVSKTAGHYDVHVEEMRRTDEDGIPAMTGEPDRNEGKGTVRSPSLTERRMARTRRQLAEVAAGLFLERGYEAVTVEEIVAAVEVSPGRSSATSLRRRTSSTRSS